MTDGLVWLVDTLGGVGYGIFGLGYSAIVLTGLHQSFPAIETSLLADIAKTGGDFIFPIAAAANVAQGAATFAIFFLTKNEKQKVSHHHQLSQRCLVTEPAMFGVNLKLKFPFFIGLGAAKVPLLSWDLRACVAYRLDLRESLVLSPSSQLAFQCSCSVL
jgi:PTS system sucrose-specific IIC component